MNSPLATHNQIAVSANTAETAINTEQTLDTSLLLPIDSTVINLVPRIETNEDEANGQEEADTMYNLGYTAEAEFRFERAQAQHFGFLYGFGLGSSSAAAAGSGYLHTQTPITNELDGDRSVPTFTAAAVFGQTLFKRRFASLAINQIVSTFQRDSWAKITGSILGTGKYTDNITEETVEAAGNTTSLTLAANAVAGSTAAARLANVHAIRVELDTGEWTEVSYSAVSAATPAVITISDPGGGAGLVDYKIIYVPTEAAWATLPARVSETPLRVAGLTLTLGGAWDGSSFVGGRTVAVELQQVRHTFNNNLRVEFVPGVSDAYAGAIIRGGRDQMILLEREMREFVLQNYLLQGEYFGMHILCVGAEYETGKNYQVEMIFPRLGVVKAPISVNNKRLAEAGDLKVFEDSTYGSIIVKVQNLQATYAA